MEIGEPIKENEDIFGKELLKPITGCYLTLHGNDAGMETTEFKASLDWPAKLVTGVMTLLFLAILATCFVTAEANSSSLAFILLPLLYFVIFLFSIRSYRISADTLCIKRLIGNKKIPIKQIMKVSFLETAPKGFTIRTLGNGGLFGYFGKFYNPSLGHMQWYATRRHPQVLLQLFNGRKIIVTPDEAADFVEIIKQKQPSLR